MDNIDFLSKLEHTYFFLGPKYDAVVSMAKKVEFWTQEFRKIVGKRPFSHVKKVGFLKFQNFKAKPWDICGNTRQKCLLVKNEGPLGKISGTTEANMTSAWLNELSDLRNWPFGKK